MRVYVRQLSVAQARLQRDCTGLKGGIGLAQGYREHLSRRCAIGVQDVLHLRKVYTMFGAAAGRSSRGCRGQDLLKDGTWGAYLSMTTGTRSIARGSGSHPGADVVARLMWYPIP